MYLNVYAKINFHDKGTGLMYDYVGERERNVWEKLEDRMKGVRKEEIKEESQEGRERNEKREQERHLSLLYKGTIAA